MSIHSHLRFAPTSEHRRSALCGLLGSSRGLSYASHIEGRPPRSVYGYPKLDSASLCTARLEVVDDRWDGCNQHCPRRSDLKSHSCATVQASASTMGEPRASGDGAATSSVVSAGSSSYSLAGAVGQQHSDAGSAASSTAWSSGSGNMTYGCKVCGEPATKTGYCAKHRRAFDCISRQYLKGTDGGYTETDDAKTFWSIFGRAARKAKGDKPALAAIQGDETIANTVLSDFCTEFPDGKDPSAKSGKLRGKMNLTRYVHTRSVAQKKFHTTSRRKMDFEAFQNHFKHFRGWNFEKAKREWSILEQDAGIARDWSGPRDHPLRLAIPSHLTCEDCDGSAAEEEERKAMEVSGKATKMSQDQQAQMKNELHKGFSRIEGLADTTFMFQPLSANALTHEGEEGTFTSMASIVEKHAKRSADEAGLGTNESPTKEPRSGEAAGSPTPKEGSGVEDVRATRNRMSQTLRKAIDSEIGKAAKALESSRSTLAEGNFLENKDFFETASERTKAVMIFLGYKSLPEDGQLDVDWTGPLRPVDLETFKKDYIAGLKFTIQTEKTKKDLEEIEAMKLEHPPDVASLQTRRLRNYLSNMALLPMENVDSFVSSAELRLLPLHVLKTLTTAECDQASETWEDQNKLLTQLLASMATAKRDLARENKNHNVAEKKKEAERLAKEQAQKKATDEMAEKLLKKKLQVQRDTTVFNHDWTSHEKLSVYSIEGFQKLRDADPIAALDLPCIIRDDKTAETCAGHEALALWMRAFPNTADCKQDHRVIAPVTEKHSAEKVVGYLREIIQMPSDAKLAATLPSLDSILKSPLFFGSSPLDVFFGFEKQYINTAQLIFQGKVKLVAFLADALVASMPSFEKMSEIPSLKNEGRLAQLIHFTRNLSQEQVKSMVGQCKAYCGEASACDIFIVPVGWLVAWAVVDDNPAGGIKLSFLTNTESTCRRLSDLSSKCNLPHLSPLVDLLRVHDASWPKPATTETKDK